MLTDDLEKEEIYQSRKRHHFGENLYFTKECDYQVTDLHLFGILVTLYS